MRAARLLACAALGIALGARGAEGQTNDVLFRPWRWIPEWVSGRSAGIGGASLPLVDDATASLLNPAGLLGRIDDGDLLDVSVGIDKRGLGDLTTGDSIGESSTIDFLGVALPLGKRLSVAAFQARPFRLRPLLTPVFRDAVTGTSISESGSLDATVTVRGLAGGLRVHPRVDVGLALGQFHLELEGIESVPGAEIPMAVDMRADNDRWRAVAGLNVRALASGADGEPEIGVSGWRGLRVSATWRSRVTWTVNRDVTASSGEVLTHRTYPLRQPQVASLALAIPWGPTLFVGQADYVAYSEIERGLVVTRGGFSPSEYRMEDAIELRGGLEFTRTYGTYRTQLRAGYHRQARAALEYVGTDAEEAAFFTGAPDPTGEGQPEGRNRFTFGLTIEGRKAVAPPLGAPGHAYLRLDVGFIFRGTQPLVFGGLGYRF